MLEIKEIIFCCTYDMSNLNCHVTGFYGTLAVPLSICVCVCVSPDCTHPPHLPGPPSCLQMSHHPTHKYPPVFPAPVVRLSLFFPRALCADPSQRIDARLWPDVPFWLLPSGVILSSFVYYFSSSQLLCLFTFRSLIAPKHNRKQELNGSSNPPSIMSLQNISCNIACRI